MALFKFISKKTDDKVDEKVKNTANDVANDTSSVGDTNMGVVGIVENTEKASRKKENKDSVKDSKEKKVEPKRELQLMDKYIEQSQTPWAPGDLVEGKVVSNDKTGVYVDLSPFGTGIIYGKEYISVRDVIKKINVGDSIVAKVIETNNKDGYIELSLKEARQAIIWSEAEEVIRDKKILELPVREANKGGLIIEWQGIQGFLPASQLKSEHYPRVMDGDKDRILEELKKLVGQKIAVSIISAVPKEGKLIFSEKNQGTEEKGKIMERYQVGDEVKGEITGIVDFGLFIKLEEGLEGLVHISEIDWSLVEDPKTLFKVKEQVRAKIIEIKDGKISLSIKALKENPWKSAEKKYKKDQVVSAVIIKYNKHGALASIEEGVAGLVHVSEFGSEEKLREKLELGKTYTFKINIFDPKDHKMALSYVEKK